jgi:hypothetical protein
MPRKKRIQAPKPVKEERAVSYFRQSLKVWSDLGALGKSVTYIAPLVTATVAAWLWLELPVPASQHFVKRSIFHEVRPLKLAQGNVQKSVDQLLLNNLQREQIEYEKDKSVQTNPNVQMRMRQLPAEIEDVRGRLNHPTPKDSKTEEDKN